MSGIAVEEESDLEELEALDAELAGEEHTHMFEEVMTDIIGAVKTPPPPLPEMIDPEVFKTQFESTNAKHALWHTQHIMERFLLL